MDSANCLGPIGMKCNLCHAKIEGSDTFYKVQFTQHKRNEMLAGGHRLRPYILCSECATGERKNPMITGRKEFNVASR